ncbi:hypothetical protein F4X33_22120 [Candidatus Poribacteria bacterium]|nr:hypothetical protein [Candidatus Poribacteria bacterium]
MPTQEQHPIKIQCLFKEQKKLCYPKEVEPVEEMIPRNAFFPGGSGLWARPTDEEWQVLSKLQICRSFFDNQDRPPMPVEKVMVLAQDFGSKCWHEKCLSEDNDLTSPTWKNLLEYLHCVGIPPKHCFFTNAYMGLMEKDRLKEMKDKEFNPFKKTCKLFLDKQIRMQKPQLILALGEYAIDLIAELSPDDLAAWRPWPGFKGLNDKSSWIDGVHFNDSNLGTVVALVHPSYRHVNIKYRFYYGKKKKAAELAMLKDALKKSGLQQ